jgi:hypothetical protein
MRTKSEAEVDVYGEQGPIDDSRPLEDEFSVWLVVHDAKAEMTIPEAEALLVLLSETISAQKAAIRAVGTRRRMSFSSSRRREP